MQESLRRSKLNLGCGEHRPIGWINADTDQKFWPDLKVRKSRALDRRGTEEMLLDGSYYETNTHTIFDHYLPIDDNEMNQVMACHMLEHVTKRHVVSLLKEIQRVLTPGGQLLIICPDIDTIIRHFLTLDRGRVGGNAGFSGNLKPMNFGPNPGTKWTGEDATQLLMEAVLEDDPNDQKLPTSEHKWNTYGSRLLDVTKKVFPNTVLLGVAGRTQEICEQGFDPNDPNASIGVENLHGEFTWVDPNSGLEWPTTGWHAFSCAVLATAS